MTDIRKIKFDITKIKLDVDENFCAWCGAILPSLKDTNKKICQRERCGKENRYEQYTEVISVSNNKSTESDVHDISYKDRECDHTMTRKIINGKIYALVITENNNVQFEETSW